MKTNKRSTARANVSLRKKFIRRSLASGNLLKLRNVFRNEEHSGIMEMWDNYLTFARLDF